MSESTWQRLFGWSHAFDEPVVVLIVALLAVALAIAPMAISVLDRAARLNPALKADLCTRYRSWLIMVPIIVVPVLLGAAWAMLAIAVLSLVCYREFARLTGLFREKAMSATVVLAMLVVTFSVFDHWYNLFVAMAPIAIIVLAGVATSLDRPAGYIQRVALAVFGFLLFGICLGHLGYLANDTHFRSLILLLIFCAQMNDVFAYMVGKSIGGPKLAPRTSPNKTVAGSLGAVVLTTLVVFGLSGLIFRHGEMSGIVQRLVLGMLISITGQFGDLSLSAIKRDLGVKDTGALIPGHGGVLDRANSLLLSAPTVFHFVGYFQGIGLDQASHIFTHWG